MEPRFPIDISNWLTEGLILQTEKHILLGEGPMAVSKSPGRGFFHPDFFLNKKESWLFPKKIAAVTRSSLKNQLFSIQNKPNQSFKITPKSVSYKKSIPPSFLAFYMTFAQLQQKIKKGILKKGVPVFFERINGPFSLITFLKTLLRETEGFCQEGFLYGAWNPVGGFLGFTPEMLFTFSGNNISLMALAGTSPHPGPPLFQDSKELEEHQLVVQGIKDSLKSNIIWKSFSFKEKKFGSLKHLYTGMEGFLKSPKDFVFLCQALHPTAALGGFPREAALEWLKQDPQQKRRGYFGAPFGFFNGRGNGFCLLALRGIEWDSRGFRLGSGCGLVKSSILQKEWRELVLKRNQIKKFFGLY